MTDMSAERAARRIQALAAVSTLTGEIDAIMLTEALDEFKSAIIREETGTPHNQFAKFAGRILESQRSEAGDVDGAFIEECLIECDLYKPTKVTKRCSENCQCEEFGFPTTCNKLTDAAREALAALPAAPDEGGTR